MFLFPLRAILFSGLIVFLSVRANCGEGLQFEELKVHGDKIYRNCTVTRFDAEGFLIRHAGGMARISFFDVEEEIREQFDFDPVEALRVYKTRRADERARRKELLLESEKWKAQMAREEARMEQEEIARKTWIPVIANIVHESDSGLFVEASRITYVPTRITSTLGFERDGPPRRVLKPFSREVIFLENQNSSNLADSQWKGFVDPGSSRTIAHPKEPTKSVRVHLAVPRQ